MVVVFGLVEVWFVVVVVAFVLVFAVGDVP